MDRQPNRNASRGRVCLRLFQVFFLASSLTFAGGLAMLPLIRRDLVERFRLMSDDDMTEAVTLSQTLPGIIALNCALYVGKRVAGWPGALLAALGTLLPAVASMLAAVALVSRLPDAPWVRGLLQGLRVAAAALILSMAVQLGRKVLVHPVFLGVAALAFVLVAFFSVSVLPVVLGAGLASLLYFRFRPRSFPGRKTGEA